jgi:hypothetical protein
MARVLTGGIPGAIISLSMVIMLYCCTVHCKAIVMKKEEIHLSDIKRILLGNAPEEFLLEVFIRSIVTYVILLIILKLLGKRMSTKLTNTEMAVMLMFGAVVSSAMQIPERGIIEGAFVLVLILLLQRSITLLALRKSKLENIKSYVEGKNIP